MTPNPRPNGKLSKQDEHTVKKLIKLFYTFMELPYKKDAEVIHMGYIQAIDIPQFIVFLMEKWVAGKERQLARLTSGTDEYADLFGQRGFTLSEFKLIISSSISEEAFDRHQVYNYLYLNDQDEREYFKTLHSDDEQTILENYIQVLNKSVQLEIPILAFFFNYKIPVYFPIKSLKKHSHLLAQSGSGKSELIKLLFYDLQRRSCKKRNKTLISIEPAGDLSIELLRFVLNKGDYKKRLVYLDPFIRQTAKSIFKEDILGADYTFVINPFELGSTSRHQINYMTQELSGAFFEIVKSEESTQMLAIIQSCVETLLWKGNSSIADLKRFMDDEDNEDLIALGKQLKNIERKKLMQSFGTNKRIASTKSGIYFRLLNLIGEPAFRKVLVGKSTVNLEKEINKGSVIICNLSKARMGKDVAPAFGKLLVALIQGYVRKRQDIPKEFRKETFCIIDEFQNFVTESIDEIMAESRKYGLHMFLSHQVLGQNMTTQMKRIISGNTAIKMAGDNEPDSLESMAKQMGSLTAKDFDRLKPYSFYVYNKFNKKAGAIPVRVPDFLVKQQRPFYMSKKELKEVFLYLVHESGYYKKVEPEKEREEGQQRERTHLLPKGKTIYKNNFDD